MKKCMVIFQISIVLFFVIKIAALGGILQNPFPDNILSAAERKQTPEVQAKGVTLPASASDATDDNLAKPRNILTALEIQKKELEQREQSFKMEEQRLLTLKKEILDKIELLRTEQEKLDTVVKNSQTAEGKRYKELAKVFDATPAAKAGAMLEQLDVKTAAGITMNMKRDKAGVIWGYLSPHKAIEITREITRTGK
jgi:flagellar motility protein MotE (MotC chaperone)